MDKKIKLKKLDVSATTLQQKTKILEYAADVRKFEISLLWQRSLFFWGFIGAAFVAYADLHEVGEGDLRLAVACFGFVCSVAWTLQNRGSKYWQEAWEQKVHSVEHAVLGADLFDNKEPRNETKFWGAWRFSVSNLLTALSDFAVLIWFALAIAVMPSARQFCDLSAVTKLCGWGIPTILPPVALIWALLMGCLTWRQNR